jgi:hypothetical protein
VVGIREGKGTADGGNVTVNVERFKGNQEEDHRNQPHGNTAVDHNTFGVPEAELMTVLGLNPFPYVRVFFTFESESVSAIVTERSSLFK